MEMINGLTMLLTGIVIGLFGYSKKIIREERKEKEDWRQHALNLQRENHLLKEVWN